VDIHMLPDLLRGEQRKAWGDGGFQGEDGHGPRSRAARTRHDLSQDEVQESCGRRANRSNTTRSNVRAKVEHVFRIRKRVFGFDKVRYRGIAKNHNRLCANFALINLYLHRKDLAPLGA
jgi:transposase, IS5 family